jgi:hypothetical protein
MRPARDHGRPRTPARRRGPACPPSAARLERRAVQVARDGPWRLGVGLDPVLDVVALDGDDVERPVGRWRTDRHERDDERETDRLDERGARRVLTVPRPHPEQPVDERDREPTMTNVMPLAPRTRPNGTNQATSTWLYASAPQLNPLNGTKPRRVSIPTHAAAAMTGRSGRWRWGATRSAQRPSHRAWIRRRAAPSRAGPRER